MLLTFDHYHYIKPIHLKHILLKPIPLKPMRSKNIYVRKPDVRCFFESEDGYEETLYKKGLS